METAEHGTLYAIVKRGQNKGIVVKPHKYEDGRYHVAKKKEDIPIPVNLDELDSYIGRGLGVRMGNKQLKPPPGLFMPKLSWVVRGDDGRAYGKGLFTEHHKWLHPHLGSVLCWSD
jgi:hypothetical protein